MRLKSKEALSSRGSQNHHSSSSVVIVHVSHSNNGWPFKSRNPVWISARVGFILVLCRQSFRPFHGFLIPNYRTSGISRISDPKPPEFLVISWIRCRNFPKFHGFRNSGPKTRTFLVASCMSDPEPSCVHTWVTTCVHIKRQCTGSLCTAVARLAQVKRRCERLVVAHAR